MAGRVWLGVLFLVAGLMHLVIPGVYLKIMPPLLPAPLALVYISGIAEMLGGAGVLISRVQRAAAWGLVALLIAVWPANLYMAMVPERFASIPPWVLWARLPLQIPLIWWAWVYTKRS